MDRQRRWNTFGGRLAAALVVGLFVGIAARAWIALPVEAAPMPPQRLVNHDLRQCAWIVPGDECGDAVLPAGWEILDSDECPAGYAEVDLRMEWIHFKTDFCCSEGHSGARGDCEDVVLQAAERRCAFVDDIHACAALPPGWAAHGGECPSGWTWTDALTCSPAELPTPTPVTQAGQGGGRPASTPQAALTPASKPAEPTPAGITVFGVNMCTAPLAPAALVIAAAAGRRRRFSSSLSESQTGANHDRERV